MLNDFRVTLSPICKLSLLACKSLTLIASAYEAPNSLNRSFLLHFTLCGDYCHVVVYLLADSSSLFDCEGSGS